MELINLEDLNLSTEESRDIIEFIAQKRGISTKELLSTIKQLSQKPLKNPKRKITENLTPEKPLKNPKRNVTENLTPKSKERIDVIREELKELSHKLSKRELKEIRKRLYMIENKKGLLESKNLKNILMN